MSAFLDILLSIALFAVGALVFLYGSFGKEPELGKLFFPKASENFRRVFQKIFLVFHRIFFSISGICTIIYAVYYAIYSLGDKTSGCDWFVICGIFNPIIFGFLMLVLTGIWYILKGGWVCVKWLAITLFYRLPCWVWRIVKGLGLAFCYILICFYEEVIVGYVFDPMRRKLRPIFKRLRKKSDEQET